MSPEEREQLWKSALNEMKTWTQVVSVLPPYDEVEKVAFRAVRKAAYQRFPAHEQLPKIAKEIAVWVCGNFDPRKRRPLPRTSRVDRAAADREVAAAYRAGQEKTPPLSMRAVAVQLGVSAATVSRALQKQHILEGETPSPENEDFEIARVRHVLSKILPRDGKRAIDAQLLADQLDLSVETMWPRLNSVSACGGWYFYADLTEVLICRGRKSSPEEMYCWRRRATDRSIVAPKRILQDYGRAVWGDLLSIYAVWRGNASADDWLAFLKVVTVTPLAQDELRTIWIDKPELEQASAVQKLVSADVEFMSNRVRSALKTPLGGDQVRSIERFNKEHHKDAAVLGQILFYVEVTRDYELEEAITAWTRVCSYSCRVQFGILPGRSHKHIEEFIEIAREYDAEYDFMEDLLAKYGAFDGDG